MGLDLVWHIEQPEARARDNRGDGQRKADHERHNRD
jgi:hypothetical protein